MEDPRAQRIVCDPSSDKPDQAAWAAFKRDSTSLTGDGPNFRRASTNSRISLANSGPSADEIHRARRRSSSMPVNARSFRRNRTLFSVA